jgi:uracil-DNA glycosylase family 4
MSLNISREDILRELELLPAWRPRETLPNVSPPNQLLADKVEPVNKAAAETLVTAPTAIQPIKVDELLTEAPLPVMDDTEVLGRAEIIQNMDWPTLQDCIKDCKACDLAATRTQTVFGVGDAKAEWMFVGEAPGEIEDKHGEPFVGEVGKLLDNMLIAMQLSRINNVFIANVLKCRPPEDREPKGGEAKQCEPYLKQQVALIKPKVIIALGKSAAHSLLQSDAPIASMRGQVHRYNDVPVIVTFHPADLLHKPEDKSKAWDDLCFAKQTMQSL